MKNWIRRLNIFKRLRELEKLQTGFVNRISSILSENAFLHEKLIQEKLKAKICKKRTKERRK